MTTTLAPSDLATRRHAVAVEWERRRRRRRRVQRVPDRFGAWMALARPEYRWDYPHFVAMQHALDRVTSGELRRWYCQVPIRHGKTEHNTIGYASYRLERDPEFRWVVTSHNDRKARKFSRAIRKHCVARGIAMNPGLAGSGEWETAAGGGVIALGAGAGTAGDNADGIIVDDPIGSRDHAESQAHRDRIWDWLSNDILGRTEPHTAVMMTMSRWHKDDPAGRLLDQFGGSWEVLDLPGAAEEHDPLGRAVGAPLWPEHRGEDWHAEKQTELLSYGYASLIQGRPRPREGGMFKWGWWGAIDAIPATGQMIRYWDLAGTRPRGSSHDPDYTAGVLMARTPAKATVIVHATRFRVEVAARDAKIVQRAAQDLAAYGRRVVYWIERQAGISGEEATDSLLRKLQSIGIAAYAESVTGSKPERATPLASAAMAGNVYLGPDDPAAPWHDAFRAEAADFPTGTHDDQIDAAAGAFTKLDRAARIGVTTFTNPL